MKKLLLMKTVLLLFALVVGSGSVWADTGTLVSGLNGISSGDTYYIAALNSSKYYTVPNTTISGQTFTCSEGSISGSTLTPATGAGEFIFTAAGGENAFYIYNTNLKKYLVATGSKKFGYVDNNSDDYGYWTFSTVSSGGFSGAFSVQHSSKTQYIRAYNNSVRCYDSTSNNGIYLFKKDPSNKVTTPSINGDTPFITSTEVSITCATTGATIQYSLDNGTSWENYSAPFTLTETKTVKAKATKSEMTNSDEASATFTKVTPMTVAAAIAYIDLGENLEGQYVSGKISQIDSYASNKITYWISDDGTKTNQMEVYQGKGLNGANFTAATDLTVGDEVVVSGDLQKYGDIYEFKANSTLLSFIPKVKAPTFSPAAGAVAANTEVTISTTTDGATIYYTTDGSVPTTNSTVYSSPITIDAEKTIKAFAVKAGHPDSDIATATYTIASPCVTPTFSVAAGEVSKGTKVTISTETDGATIYYTTDGSTPTTSSTAYSSAITINSATTLKAIAAKDGMANSEVATAAYTVRDYVILPFLWAGGTNTSLANVSGVTTSGCGDYNSNVPYQVKMDGAGDYIQIKTNEQIGKISFGIKMVGGSSESKVKVQESENGSTFTDVEEFTISGSQNEILNFVTSTALKDASRYVRIIKSIHGSNIGVGPIGIAKPGEPALPLVSGTTVTLTTTVNMAGWRAFYSESQGYTLDANTKAYVATAKSGTDAVTLTTIDAVPAGTPVILKTTDENREMTLTEGTPAAYTGTNYLKVTTGGEAIDAYRLGYNSTDGVAFYPYAVASAPAGVIYLELPAGARVLEMNLEDGDVTAIETVKAEKANNEYYNLAGQRVANPTKGLYIVNGRKVVVK